MSDNGIKDGKKAPVAVLGAGPGGYPAAFLAADLGFDVTLIDASPNPGGVCLFRGCIPSKALLHVARLIHESREAADWGIGFTGPTIDMDKLRAWKDQVVGKLTGGLGSIGRSRNVRFVRGRGRFTDAHTLAVEGDDGAQTIAFDYAIVATGSSPARIPNLWIDSPRVMDSTAALKLEAVPSSLLVIGGGYIGLELGTVYQALGSKVTCVEMTPGLLPGVDRDLVQYVHKNLQGRFEHLYTDTRVLEMKEEADGIRAKFVGLHVEQTEQLFDRVLVAVGRRPNSADLGLENIGVTVSRKGFIEVDRQRRTKVAHIFAIGDVAGEPMLAHKATYEARIAVEAMADQPSAYDPAAIPAVVFTDPEIAWSGLSETDALNQGRSVKIARFPWTASGRATTLDRNDGLTKMVLDPVNQRVLGVGIAGVGAGEMIAEGTLAIEMGATAQDVKMTIHAHPTLSETVMEAAEAFFGHSPHIHVKR
ncbi:MAG: Dihydrolipoyl dehydrogenase [Phycisphaerae bacterium]|nr:Dihydrolipoyl dehydrogenase [Phycisphaerae bacterium]